MISNCGHDEKGKYSGGEAGDQTKQEYRIIPWYNRPWNVVLRHPDEKVGQLIAHKAENAAKNNNIGYDQGNRLSFYNELKANNWIVKDIDRKCEADCSASTSAIVIACGYRLAKKKLQEVSPSNTTSTLRASLKKAGFKVLTQSKYLVSDDFLLPGDILLYEGHHVAINITKGTRA